MPLMLPDILPFKCGLSPEIEKFDKELKKANKHCVNVQCDEISAL